MTDDRSPNDFEEYLKRKGWHFDRKGPENGLLFYIVDNYYVINGQNSGRRVTLALPIPIDYPSTAPYGIHLRNGHGLTGNIPNAASSLGGDWQFWSRRMNGWDIGRRNAQYYIDNVNRWLEAP